MTSRSALAFAALSIALCLPATAIACLHMMANTRPMDGPSVELVVAWEAGQEDLVVVLGLPKDVQSKRIAYILPVPSIPTYFGTVSKELAQAPRRYMDLRYAGGARTPGPTIEIIAGDPVAPPALEVHEVKKVGPFDVHPIEARGAKGLQLLQAWMGEHGFPPLTDQVAAYYVEREWAFLAVEADPHVDQMPALHVRFDAARIVVPIKLLVPTNGSRLQLTATILAGAHLASSTVNELGALGFEVVSGHNTANSRRLATNDILTARSSNPESRELISRFAIRKRKEIAATVLFAEDLSRLTIKASDWSEDLSLPLAEQTLWGGDRMPPMPPGAVKPPFDVPKLPAWPVAADVGLGGGADSPAKGECAGCGHAATPGSTVLLLFVLAFLRAPRRYCRRPGGSE